MGNAGAQLPRLSNAGTVLLRVPVAAKLPVPLRSVSVDVDAGAGVSVRPSAAVPRGEGAL